MIFGGKFGYVSLGAGLPAFMNFADWTLSFDGDDPDATNFLSGGCDENVEGIDGGTLNMSGPLNTGNVGLQRGKVYVFNLGVGPGYFFSISARVKTLAPSQKVRGKGELQVTAKTTGPFVPLVL
jgi:hypothetical protein